MGVLGFGFRGLGLGFWGWGLEVRIWTGSTTQSHSESFTKSMALQYALNRVEHTRERVGHTRASVGHTWVGVRHTRVGVRHTRVGVRHARASVSHTLKRLGFGVWTGSTTQSHSESFTKSMALQRGRVLGVCQLKKYRQLTVYGAGFQGVGFRV